MTIRNNTFENISFGRMTGYPLYVSPLLRPEQRLGAEKYHQNIRFTNNEIKSFNGHMIFARSVKGFEIKGNHVQQSDDYPNGSKLPAIALDYCEDVDIQQNQFTGFDWPMKVTRSSNTTAVTQKKNKGLSSSKQQPLKK